MSSIEEKLYKQRALELEKLFEKSNWIFRDVLNDKAPRAKRVITLPNGIEVAKTIDFIEIDVHWSKNVIQKNGACFVLFVIVWNILSIGYRLFMVEHDVCLALLMFSPLILIGLALAYYSIALLINTSTIYADREKLTITNSPLLRVFIRNKTVPVSEIKQLFLNKKYSKSQSGEVEYFYSLNLKNKKGRKFILIEAINKKALLFLEQEIEWYLGLKDDSSKEAIRTTY